ncbi:hypothetical protein BDU57DRAFT_539164 [Ampelomyces quisqualis]|uniref:Uncharacterized protein n=1 Tax=Ampelomyces quisqualis TaxID=50730 RepID=A0A6A5QMR1_AMPQU|nr:hypothetical protein BDU57DRAFT_539164 [Ampelomyces quisqualis]
MTDKLMDTEPGGQQTQYEGIHTFVEPHAKQPGQLGDPATHTSTQPPNAPVDQPNTQGVSNADKIRYGQSIQEGGAGGKTMGSTGQANAEVGFGGTKGMEEKEDGFEKERREQGYGGGKDMDRKIGG